MSSIKSLIFIALVMTSEITPILVDNHNQRTEIKKFARDTVNVNQDKRWIAYYKPELAERLEALMPLPSIDSLNTSSMISASRI